MSEQMNECRITIEDEPDETNITYVDNNGLLTHIDVGYLGVLVLIGVLLVLFVTIDCLIRFAI